MQYQAPANDLRFLLFDVLGADRLHELEKYADATPDLISAVIDEAGKLAAEVIQPTNQAGDREGCTYDPETHTRVLQGRLQEVCRGRLDRAGRTP